MHDRPHHRLRLLVALAVGALAGSLSAQPADPFRMNVRPTPHLSPDEERVGLQVPDGFEVELFASEPDILKPMNMAFDERGRLWVTDSREYPFPVPPGKEGRDNVRILEDLDGDGHADLVTTFATGLSIPIGLYPWKGGAIVFSVPYIWQLEDTDGDGRCDRRKPLYGPFGWKRDAHGLNNSFHRGFDGWVYACHGFNNHTTVQGTDGHSIHMESGNTYRFRLDGSRIEHFTHGQVNPFGMAFDVLGNIFTADCHSKPAYQLIRGGYYPSFGRPHDGLGFVPPMMQHGHGSTAICGIIRYQGGNFPAAFRGNLFIGNVVTCRINRDRLVEHGSTIRALEMPDFLSSKDPWFRPVNLREAPDGTLYVADFYNRIIGHYEVPLDHPGRDRTSGRIWRIVYRGREPSVPPEKVLSPSLEHAPLERLLATLEHPSLAWRLLATQRLVDVVGPAAAAPVAKLLGTSKSALARSHALWILDRLGALGDAQLEAAARDRSEVVRVHAMKVLAERESWRPIHRRLALAALSDPNAFVQRSAADAVGRRGEADDAHALLRLLARVPPADVLLRHQVRISLRDLLARTGALARLGSGDLAESEAREVASLLISIRSPASAKFLLAYLERYPERGPTLSSYLRHAAAFLPAEQTPELVRLARRGLGSAVDVQLDILESLRRGLVQRGVKPGAELGQWAASLAEELIDSLDENSRAWRSSPLAPGGRGEDPWDLESCPSSDGHRGDLFLSTRPAGEQATGRLTSPPFEIPRELSFWIAGHLGPPGAGSLPRSAVRLRDAESGRIVAEARPPRQDTARAVHWDLSASSGRRGRIEIEDGHDEPSFAWMSVGRFEPSVLSLPAVSPRRVGERLGAAAQLAAQFRLEALAGRLSDLVLSSRTPPLAREAIARALLVSRPDSRIAALLPLLADPTAGPALQEKVAQAVVNRDAQPVEELLTEALKTTPARLQAELALRLAADRESAELLMSLVEKGLASPRLLLRRALREKLAAAGPGRVVARLEALTADLPSANEELLATLRARVDAYRRSRPSAEAGATIFEKNCRPCHQIAGKGNVVGPQLDGIGGRGLERVIEDVLDPNRNVDVAFRSTTLVLADGQVLSGLFRREEGETLVYVDSRGEEFTVSKDDILEKTLSEMSLMPDNMEMVLEEGDFLDLVAFLLQQ